MTSWLQARNYLHAEPEDYCAAILSGMGEILKLVAIRCGDVERSVRFYERLLGRAFVEEQHGNGPRHYAVVLNGTVFALYPRKGSEGVDKETRFGLAVSDLGVAIEWARSAGVAILREPADSPWGRRAVVSDPDGRCVELYAERGA